MREIKFRIWSELRQRWVNPVMDITNNFYDNDNENRVFEQFTGLKDKNGVDIYEGDKTISFDGNGIVVWHETGWKLKFEWDDHLQFFQTFISDLEVIGNIHESKEVSNG